ncbi:MAG: DegT/DnrJ/EryC1/StrS family aminotransferase [Oscillospiraceae bacterium]|nr:DegT/DnrJ/EryC1/StrS family aminotransferase [Oscillospiraceae bacterium]
MSIFTCRADFLPFSPPSVSPLEISEMTAAVKSGWWAKGPRTQQFEEAFAAYTGAKYAVGVNSCTAALHIALIAAGVRSGDEVITTPYTFCSTVNTILHVGATPVFVDIDPDTGLMDPRLAEAAITPRTKAIVPVHFSGMACDLDALYALADRHGLFVSEDAAHAVETRYKGKRIGGGAPGAVSFSFYATKNLATGEGGMLCTDRKDIAERARMLASHGMSAGAWNRYGKGGAWRYEVEEPGFKYNMFDLQAALGLAQLERMPQLQADRLAAAAVYDKAFAGMPQLALQENPAYSTHSRHLYVLRLRPEALAIDRDQFIQELAARNIGASVHFIPVHLLHAYQRRYGFKPGDFPLAEAFFAQEISMPLHAGLSAADAAYVTEAVRDIVAAHLADI